MQCVEGMQSRNANEHEYYQIWDLGDYLAEWSWIEGSITQFADLLTRGLIPVFPK
jgi:hypothetical protein